MDPYQRRLVEGAIGGGGHRNGWNGMVSNTSNIWKHHVWKPHENTFDSIPAITMSLSYSSSHLLPLIPIQFKQRMMDN
jgi:hypothetical protein